MVNKKLFIYDIKGNPVYLKFDFKDECEDVINKLDLDFERVSSSKEQRQ